MMHLAQVTPDCSFVPDENITCGAGCTYADYNYDGV